MSFWGELRKRNVVRVAVAYAIVAWLLIQVTVSIEDPLGLPEWVDTLVILILVIGFVVALFLAWAYELTPDGIRRTEEKQHADAATQTNHRAGSVLTALLILLVAFLLVDKYLLDRGDAVTSQSATEIDEAITTLLVLPLRNISSAQDNDSVVDGLTVELIRRLQQFPGIRVIGQETSFANRGKSVPEVATRFGIEYVLEGSITWDADLFRVNLQLSDPTGFSIWPYRYEGEHASVFAVQDEIVQGILTNLSDALGVSLIGADAVPFRPAAQTAPDTYADYVSAVEILSDPTFESLAAAEALLESVIDRDPGYAPAQGVLAWILWRAIIQGSRTVEETHDRMRSLSASALRLDPFQPEAWIVQASVAWLEGNVALSRLARERALEVGGDNEIVIAEAIWANLWTRDRTTTRQLAERLPRIDPQGPESLRRASHFYTSVNERERARELLEQIHALDPTSVRYHWDMHAQDYLNTNFSEMRRLLEEVYALDPLDPEGPAFLGEIFLELGDLATASQWSGEADDVDPDHPASLMTKTRVALARNDADEATALAERLLENDVPGRSGSKALALGLLAQRDLARRELADATIARYLETYPQLAWNEIPIRTSTDSFPLVANALYAALDLARIYRRAGRQAESEALLDAVEQELQFWPRLSIWGIGFADAELYALRDQTDDSIRALRTAIDENVWRFWRWRVLDNPNFDSLRGNAEFEALVREGEAKMAARLESMASAE